MTYRSVRLRFLIPCLSALALGAVALPSGAQEGSLFDDPILGDDTGETADPLATDGGLGTEQPAMTQEQFMEEYNRKLEAAEALMAQENWSEALTALNELNATARHPRVMLNLGICFKELGMTEQAIQYLSMVMMQPGAASQPGVIDRAYMVRGELYVEGGRYREAVDDFTQAATLNATNPEPLYQQARAMLRLVATSPGGGMDQAGQSTLIQAAKTLDRAIGLRSDYGDAYLERGRVLFQLRQMDSAISDYQQAVQHLGATSVAAAELGMAYAVRANQEIYRPEPDSSKIVQRLRDAIKSLSDALGDAPLGERRLPWETTDPFELQTLPENIVLTRGDAHIALGHELSGEEQTAEYRSALADADRLLATDVDEVTEGRAYYLRGSALRLLGDLDGAIGAFNQSIRLLESVGRSTADAYIRRGICYYYQDRLGAAMQDFQAAATVPNSPYIYEPRAMMWAGIVYARQGDFSEAIRSYTRSLAAAPRYTAAYLNRGLAYMNMGRYDMAMEDFDTILRQQPDHAAAQRYRELASRQR